MVENEALVRADALMRGGRLVDAETICTGLLSNDPDNVTALHMLGLIRARQGQYTEAAALIGAAAKMQPSCIKIMYSHALVLYLNERYHEALVQAEEVVQKVPAHADAWNIRGLALRKLNCFEDALASFDRVLTIEPRIAEAWNNRGNVLSHLRRRDEALASYEAALSVQPTYAEAWANRGHMLVALAQLEDASASYNRALAINPDFVAALAARAEVYWLQGNHQVAICDLERVLQLDPEHAYARGTLLHWCMHLGRWEAFEPQKAAIDAGVRAGKRVIEPFDYQAISGSPEDLRACSEIYAVDRYPPTPKMAFRPYTAAAKIRLGYVSGEFCEQATAFLTAGLYENHDKTEFEIVAFDNGHGGDSRIRKRLETAFDRIIPIAALSDPAAAAEICAQGIDILINLNGYFGNERTRVFAFKPAPLQVAYLGFPGTMGTPYMDYLVADRFVIPDSERRFYAEQIVYLPDSYQANDDRRPAAHTVPRRFDVGLPECGFVFCNFNQSYKLTPACFDLWMRILRRSQGSVLWLLESNSELAGNLRHEAEARGVAGTRLIFAPTLTQEKHLARMALADLFLDSLPYNGHTTASDALWAGVPLVTNTGTSFPGRVATSLLHAIGLSELVTESEESFEALAVGLACDSHRYRTLREKLAENRVNAALFNTKRFCRRLESAYRLMWDRNRRGEAPHGFSIPF